MVRKKQHKQSKLDSKNNYSKEKKEAFKAAKPNHKQAKIETVYQVFLDDASYPSYKESGPAIEFAKTLIDRCKERVLVVEIIYTVGTNRIFEYRKDDNKNIEKIVAKQTVSSDPLNGKELYIWSEEDFQ